MSVPLPDLRCPSSRLVVEQSHLAHPQSRHESIIQDHPFNYMLETIVPNCTDQPDIDSSGLKYYEARIQASALIHKAFIDAFIKRGKLQLISNQSKIDSECVLALSPRGCLTLHLTKDSYQQLGIDGKLSRYCRKTKLQKYVVEIDMLQSYFQPGKKNYERVRECLASNHSQLYDVVFTWKPDDESIAPVSVAKYFQMIGYECKEMDLEVVPQVMKSITSCPLIDTCKISNDSGGHVSYDLLWEWLGAVACNVDIKNDGEGEDGFVSTYSCPEPSQKIEGIFKESVTGFISIADIHSRFQQLRELSKRYGWCAMTVHGFADTPVSWKSKEHSYLLDGDNIYTFVVFADDTYWLFYGLSSYDDCP